MRLRTAMSCLPAIAVTAVLLLNSSIARAVEYDPDRDVRLTACDKIYDSGEIDAAINCFEPLLAASSLHVAAEAAWALGRTKDANQLFRRAVQSDPTDPHVRARWGRLFLSTHQPSQALPLFEEALQLKADYLHARIGLAVALQSGASGEAQQVISELAASHQDSVEVLLLLARMQLENKKLDIADAFLDNALLRADEQNITPLDIYALKASATMLRDENAEVWAKKALAINPRYGDVYYVPSHYHLINYRYREAVEVLRKAVAVQPTHWSAHSQLGINLLRLNDIAGAKKHLAIAYRGDPFDTATINTLRLLDTLDEFVDLDTQATFSYADRQSNTPIVMRLHNEEAVYLAPYVEELTRRAVETFTRRYQFELAEPLIVELFPSHDDFGVRTVSTPGVGLLGVTFGYLLAMDSPSARPPGEFHWGSTLWHELAHVFTIESADHRMPRWFTEGVSVYEEWYTGPLPGRHIPLEVLQAISEDKLLPVAELDNGFVRPTYKNQVTVSYMQAGLICELIRQKWGHDKLVAMLAEFKQRKDTETTINNVLGISATTLDTAVDEHIQQHYGAVLDNFEKWRDIVASLHDAVQHKQYQRALDLGEQANEIFPDYVGKSNAWLAIYKAQSALGQNTQAIETLFTWYENGGHDPQMLHQLAHSLRDSGQTERSIKVLESIVWVAPNNVDLHEKLGADYTTTGNYLGALREYQALLGLKPHDKSVVYLNIAKSHQKLGNNKQAKRNVLRSLEHAPFYRQAQDLLLELTTGDAS